MTEKKRGACPECGKRRMLWLIRDNVKLCSECADFWDWVQCDLCGDFYPYGDVEFTELPDGKTACEYCMGIVNHF